MELTRHPWKQVEFELYKNNEPTGKTYILNDDNNWCIEEWLDDEHEWDFREINIPRGYTPKYRTYKDDDVIVCRASNKQISTLIIKCLFMDIDKSVRPSTIEFNQIDNYSNVLCYSYNGVNEFEISESEIDKIEPVRYKDDYGVDISDFVVGGEEGLYDYVKIIEYNGQYELVLRFIFFDKSKYHVKGDVSDDRFYSKSEIDALIYELKKDKNNNMINKLNKKIQKISRDVDNLNKLLNLIIKNSN